MLTLHSTHSTDAKCDTQDGQEPISRRADVVAQAKTSTFLSLRIAAAAGIWNAQARTSTTSCAAILIIPLPSPLPFITQHRWRARAGAGRRRRHNTHVKAVPAVSVLRRAPPADWPACGLELVYVQTCLELQAHDGCAGCIYLLKETDAPAVVDIRQAAPLVSQRGARQTRAALETQQKGDRWKIRFFVASFGKWL